MAFIFFFFVIVSVDITNENQATPALIQSWYFNATS